MSGWRWAEVLLTCLGSLPLIEVLVLPCVTRWASPFTVWGISLALFLNPDAWTGGSIDSMMFFGPASVDFAMEVARTLWSFQRLHGPFRDRTTEPENQEKLKDFDFSEDCCENLIGTYLLSGQTLSPFEHTTILDSDGLWVYAGIPVGSLPLSWDVGAYPFDDGKPISWLPPLTEELRELTHFVNARHPILASMYGWIIGDMEIGMIKESLAGRIPTERWHPMEIRKGDRLEYFPMTRMESLFRKA